MLRAVRVGRGMGNFFTELKRRHIYRVGAAYAVVAWVLLQLVNNLAPGLKLPDWAVTFVIVMLAIGFPIALIFAWMLEMKAPAADGAQTQSKTSPVDWILAGALVAVIGIFGYEQVGAGARPGEATQANIAANAATAGGISIAVLPFANMSADVGQEFFSDGITEEINTALAKVQDLHIVARTSAFQFKGQNRDVQAIAQQLHATHVIEGSVRKQGDRVRITAELIRADNGLQLWSENYDRQLTDIFAIQEEIAQAIAASLRVPLGLGQGESLVPNRTGDLESYQQYLHARAMVRARTLTDAIAVLEPVVAKDPQFAPASALLGQAYALLPIFSSIARNDPASQARAPIQSFLDKGETAARRAIQSDAKNASGYAGLALLRAQRGKWLEADDLFRQALALDPNDPEALNYYSVMLANLGLLKDALRLRERLRALEPFVPIYNILTASIMRTSGQDQAAIPILEATPPDPAVSYLRNLYLAWAYTGVGRYAEAADVLLAIQGNLVSRRSVEDAARLLRSVSPTAKPPQTLPAIEGEIGFVYGYVGAPTRMMESPERALALGILNVNGNYMLWLPDYAGLRKTERFKKFVRDADLVVYWRARGWPNLCRPMGADDFACD